MCIQSVTKNLYAIFVWKSKLMTRIKNNWSESNVVCILNSFKSDHILKMHILKVHERIDQRICDVCAKVFKTKEGFQDHMKTQHMGIEEPRVQCTICGAWLKNRGTLNKHMKIHTDSPQVCDICHKMKPTRTALNHHKRLVHGDASFHCTICKKTFKRQLSLTVSLKFCMVFSFLSCNNVYLFW